MLQNFKNHKIALDQRGGNDAVAGTWRTEMKALYDGDRTGGAKDFTDMVSTPGREEIH